MFIQNSYRFGTVESLLLDTYTGAAAAYSLRKLKTGVTNVVRVRRSNDSTEQNFTATEITDGTLTTFTGANDGLVTILYDQSGSGKNAIQTIATSQPKIVSNGVVNIDNGKPYMYTNGDTRGTLVIASPTGLNNTAASIFGTYNSNDTGNGVLASCETNHLLGTMRGTSTGSSSSNAGNPSYYVNSALISPDNGEDLHNNYVINQDVIFSTLDIDFSSTSWGNNFFRIFGYISSDTFSAECKIKELIIYNSDQSANRTGIETNINTEYSIFPDTAISGLLFDYPNASAAYSLRQLTFYQNGYAPNVVRVRRSNDNTEQNFTPTEITDGTLTTFTGANDGFVL